MVKAVQKLKGSVGKRARLRKKDRPIRVPDTAKRERVILKRLQSIVKKAKQFETGKLMRRVKIAVKQQEGETEAQVKHRETAALDKLQFQLRAAKEVKAADLAILAGKQCGLDSLAEKLVTLTPDATAAATSLESALQLVAARILAHKTVREEVQAVRTELEDLHKLAARAAAAQERAAARAAEADEPTANKALNGDVGPSDADLDLSIRKTASSGDDMDEDQDLVASSSGADVTKSETLEAGPSAHSASHKRNKIDGTKSKTGSAASKGALHPKKKKNRIGSRERRRLKEEAAHSGRQPLTRLGSAPGSRQAGPSGGMRPVKGDSMTKRRRTDAATAPASRKAPHSIKAAGTRPSAGAASVSVEAGAGLHPSWVAKQRQKSMLAKQPQGKKIVFEEY